MSKLKSFTFWFITGSQPLYGEETVQQVAGHSKIIVEALDRDSQIPCNIVFKPVVTNPDSILKVCLEANADESCTGIITWMHTFSPAKMWIAGLTQLKKPLLHLHTQFNRDIPWGSIDMDFMNLNQSAHGDREYGFIGARLRLQRKVVVGHWDDVGVKSKIGAWMRSACGMAESKSLKLARFGDNMRHVAVTEGDKVEAQIKLGWSVNGYGVGDLAEYIQSVSEADINALMNEYNEKYIIAEEALKDSPARDAVREQARIELGMKSFLDEGGYKAFTTTFENLHGIKQLPGLAVQRLMEAGYGFGGEGDWKTSAMVRIMKVMASGCTNGTSFMEDYTYHLEPGNEMVLGAHMLEVCPTIADSKPRIEVHPLSIGGKADPARIVFDGKSGPAINASLVDMGGRFRLIINEVEAVSIEKPMPKLPVARVLWKPMPSLSEGAEAWILAGGAHHTCFSLDISAQQMVDWAELAGIECVVIDKNTNPLQFRNELRWNDIAWNR